MSFENKESCAGVPVIILPWDGLGLEKADIKLNCYILADTGIIKIKSTFDEEEG